MGLPKSTGSMIFFNRKTIKFGEIPVDMIHKHEYLWYSYCDTPTSIHFIPRFYYRPHNKHKNPKAPRSWFAGQASILVLVDYTSKQGVKRNPPIDASQPSVQCGSCNCPNKHIFGKQIWVTYSWSLEINLPVCTQTHWASLHKTQSQGSHASPQRLGIRIQGPKNPSFLATKSPTIVAGKTASG